MSIYKTMLLDADGVLLNWKKSFQKYVVEQLYIEVSCDFTHADVTDWLGISKVEAMRLVDEFHNSPYFSDIEPFPDAVENIAKLVNEGWRFAVITACGEDEEVAKKRKYNLENVFGNIFDDVHVVDVHDSKLLHLEKYKPAVWVEDSLHHAIDGANHGHKTFFIDRYNRNLDVPEPIIPVHSWDEIYQALA